MKKDFYEILGVNKDSTPEELKKAYRALCKEHHPDQDGDREVFESIKKAYNTLKYPEKRDQYDKYGENADDLKIIINTAIVMFRKAISFNDYNIEANITSVYNEFVGIAKDNINKCNDNINKNEFILNKIVNAPKNDFIGDLLRNEIKTFKISIECFKKSIEDLTTAYEMLNGYMFDSSVNENPLLNDSFSEWMKTGTMPNGTKCNSFDMRFN